MKLEVSESQAEELEDLLRATLGEMSHEIAATDNAEFRAELMSRRQLLLDVADTLRARRADLSQAVERELAHPGG